MRLDELQISSPSLFPRTLTGCCSLPVALLRTRLTERCARALPIMQKRARSREYSQTTCVVNRMVRLTLSVSAFVASTPPKFHTLSSSSSIIACTILVSVPHLAFQHIHGRASR